MLDPMLDRTLAWTISLVVLLASSCVERADVPCLPGMPRACTCSDGGNGFQRCLVEQRLGPCSCSYERVEAGMIRDAGVTRDTAMLDKAPVISLGQTIVLGQYSHFLRRIVVAATSPVNSLVVLDPETLTSKRLVLLPFSPTALALSADGRFAGVVAGPFVIHVDLQSLSSSSIEAGLGPLARITVSSNGTVYALIAPTLIGVIVPERSTKQIDLAGLDLVAIEAHTMQGFLYAVARDGGLRIIEVNFGGASTVMTVSAPPLVDSMCKPTLVLTADGKRLWVGSAAFATDDPVRLLGQLQGASCPRSMTEFAQGARVAVLELGEPAGGKVGIYDLTRFTRLWEIAMPASFEPKMVVSAGGDAFWVLGVFGDDARRTSALFPVDLPP